MRRSSNIFEFYSNFKVGSLAGVTSRWTKGFGDEGFCQAGCPTKMPVALVDLLAAHQLKEVTLSGGLSDQSGLVIATWLFVCWQPTGLMEVAELPLGLYVGNLQVL